jgi:hypothetical protein
MKIVLHILAKDLRRHRWEIALLVLAGAAWVWQTVSPLGWEWLRQRGFVPVLFFGLWFFVTIRVVQGESLVGDREFWMTRPYRWGQLIVAKALLLVLCLNVPFFIAHIVFLHSADIPLSWNFVPGLLFLQLGFAFFFTFPAAALATVTESLVQWGLAVAGMFVYALMLSWLPWNKLPQGLEGGESVCTVLGMALIAPALAFVLVWQYARRRVWPARMAYAGALLVVPLVILLSRTPLIRSIAYPHEKGPGTFQLSVAEDQAGNRSYTRTNDGAVIGIPVVASTGDADTTVDADGLQVTLTGDSGWRWQSEWLNHSISFSKDSPTWDIRFEMPSKLADQMARLHAKASVELAYGVYRFGRPLRVDTSAKRFELPGVGFCHWYDGRKAEIFLSDTESLRNWDCVAPLKLPEIVEIRVESGASTCPQNDSGEPPLPGGHFATQVEHGTSLPADFDPEVIHKFDFSFGAWEPLIPTKADPKSYRLARLCKGTPLTVRTGTLEARMRTTFDLGSIGTEKLIKEESEQTVPFQLHE